jgi:hypothetical protein
MHASTRWTLRWLRSRGPSQPAWSCYPGISGREFAEETTGSRKFLGDPNYPFAHVQSTPAGLRPPDHCGVAAWPLVSEQQRLPRKVFRRSIAWFADSLPTLRSAGYPRPTQDSLPAVGQALPDGISTRRVPLKGFRAVSYISSPFPKLLAAIGSTEASDGHLGARVRHIDRSDSPRLTQVSCKRHPGPLKPKHLCYAPMRPSVVLVPATSRIVLHTSRAGTAAQQKARPRRH